MTMPKVQNTLLTRKERLSAEAQRLYERLNGIASSFRSVSIAVVADAGMGKTFTVKQALAALPCTKIYIQLAEPLHWLHTRLPPAKKPLPIWAQQVFKQINDQQIPPEKSVAQALLTYFAAISPVVVHLEDAHDASSQQLALWVLLAEMLSKTKGIGLVVTSRLPLSAVFQELNLQALDLTATQALLQNITEYPLPLEAVQWIHNNSLGNPLFSLEFYEHALRQGFLWQHQKQWFWQTPAKNQSLPKDLEAIVMIRLERMLEISTQPMALKRVLLTLALLPEVRALQDQVFASWSTTEQDCYNLELLATGIWANNQFVHPIYPEVLRLKIWAIERALVARELIIPSLEFAPELMERLVIAANLEPKEALELWLQISSINTEHGRKFAAGRALVQAVNFAAFEDKAEIAYQAAELLKPFDRSESVQHYEIAYHLEPKVAKYILGWCLALQVFGCHDEAEALLVDSASLMEFDTAWFTASLRLQAAQGNYTKTLTIWQEHEELQKECDPMVNWGIAVSLIQLSRPLEAYALIDQIITGSISLETRLRLMNVKAVGLQNYGELAASEDICNQALALVLKHPEQADLLRTVTVLLTQNRGLARLHLGRIRDAISDLETSLKISRELGDPFSYTVVQSKLANPYLYLGQFERVETLLLEAREILRNSSEKRDLVALNVNLARLYLEWMPLLGEILSLKYAREALYYQRMLSSESEFASHVPSIAQAECMYGNPQDALVLIDEQLLLAKKLGLKIDISHGAWVRSRIRFALGFINEAKQEMTEALALVHDNNTGVIYERFALEFDWLFQDLESAATRIERLKQMGEDANLALHVAKRYFPNLFTSQSPPKSSATQKLEVLGEMCLNGQVISKRLRKAKELLIVLFEARLMGRGSVSQLELMDALYPTEDETQAASSIRQLIYRIRKSFGEDMVLNTTLGYSLGVATDAEEFIQTLDTTLWRGQYLSGETSQNSSVTEALTDALTRAITQTLPVNPLEAARAGKILLDLNPYQQTVLKLYIKALATAQTEDIGVIYQAQRKFFLEIGEKLPIAWQEFLTA